MTRRRIHILLGCGAILSMIGVSAWVFRRAPSDSIERSTPPLPPLITAEVEPQVLAKIQAERQAVLRDAESSSAWGRLGRVYHAHHLYAEAVHAYRRAAELDPTEYRWPYGVALIVSGNNSSDAIVDYERTVAAGGNTPAVHVNFGNALLQVGQLDRAREQFRTALERDDRCTHALYGLGQVAVAESDLAAAVTYLTLAAEIAPTHGQLHGLLAQVYHRLGRTGQAEIEELRARAYPGASTVRDPVYEQIEAEAVSSAALVNRGQRLGRAGEFEQAERAFRRVLEIRPGHARDYANLGGALEAQDRVDEAIEQYRRAIKLNPDAAYAHGNLGLALARTGKLAEAVEQFLEAVRLDRSDADLFNLGLLRVRQQQLDLAINRFEEALRANPAHLGAHNELAKVLAARSRADDAVRHLRQSVAIEPRQLRVWADLGVLLAAHGRHEESIAALREGLHHGPDSSTIAAALAWELATAPEADLRNGTEAVQLARRVHEKNPKGLTATDVLAAALAEVGQFDQAAELAQQGLELAQEARQFRRARDIQSRLTGYRRQQPHRQRKP